MTTSLASISDDNLLQETARAATDERHSTVHLIAPLGELDGRRLYLGEGCSSLFTYCTRVLHLSEHAAYGRIEAARAARSYPIILDLLTEGALTLTAVGLLRPHLTPQNHCEVFASARHKSKREIEELVGRLHPQPITPSSVRRLPATTAVRASVVATCTNVSEDSSPCAHNPLALLSVTSDEPTLVPEPAASPHRPAVLVKPIAPERYRIQFTVSAETHAKLCRAQDLLRHRVPSGDPAGIFDVALSVLVEQIERTKLGAAQLGPDSGRERRTPYGLPDSVQTELRFRASSA